MHSNAQGGAKALNSAVLFVLIFTVAATARATVSVNPNQINFGSRAVSSSGAPAMVTLTNGNRGKITIVRISASPAQFVYSGPALPVTLNAGQSLSVSVTFTPTAAQAYQGTISFTRTYGQALTGELSGTGVQQQAPAAVAPSITAQPVSQTITSGQTATFSVAATGTAPLTYQWTANGAAISGATAASYTTPAATSSNNGSPFSVTVRNSAGSVTSNNATLTVNAPPPATVPPSITTQPISQTITSGQTATFSVAATGTAPLTYQWTANGAAISGATSASYTTPATTSSNNGSPFGVTVRNSAGTVTSNNATLTVSAAQYTMSSKPPSLSFTAAAGGSAPAAQSVKIIDNDPACTPFTAAVTQNWLSVTPTSSCAAGFLSVSLNPAGLAAGSYSGALVITSSQEINSPMSVPITVTITATSTAPTITTQPVSQTITSGQTATFSVAATGNAPLTYQWAANGSAISGATSASYTTPATTASNNGALFKVTISNSAGTVTSNNATLTVSSPLTSSLSVSSSSLALGSVNVGASNTLLATLTNSGNANIAISNISISGAGFGASGISTGQVLAPAGTATLSVSFAPAAAGSATGSVTVTSNASNSPTTISLSGSGVQLASHSATLSWNASTSAVTGYNIYRGTVSGGPYVKSNSSEDTTTTFTDTTVQSGQTYYYVVTSLSASDVESPYSNQVSAAIP